MIGKSKTCDNINKYIYYICTAVCIPAVDDVDDDDIIFVVVVVVVVCVIGIVGVVLFTSLLSFLPLLLWIVGAATYFPFDLKYKNILISHLF